MPSTARPKFCRRVCLTCGLEKYGEIDISLVYFQARQKSGYKLSEQHAPSPPSRQGERRMVAFYDFVVALTVWKVFGASMD
jgi:hypothetical protein